MATKKKKIIIFGDPRKPTSIRAAEEFVILAAKRVSVISNCLTTACTQSVLKKADFAVVFGGDGTILSAARLLCETSVPVIGVNVGRLGFLAEFSPEELPTLLERIEAGNLLIEKRMILDCNITRQGKSIFSSTAVNDVIVTSGQPFHMIDLRVTVKGQPLASCNGDGIIVSTPTGSTAHNLSAGGPILSANLSAMVITPICAHSLSFRPIVINADNPVEIAPTRLNRGSCVILDGQLSQPLHLGDTIKICRHHGAFLVVNNPSRTQWDTLADKLCWAGKPNYGSSNRSKKTGKTK